MALFAIFLIGGLGLVLSVCRDNGSGGDGTSTAPHTPPPVVDDEVTDDEVTDDEVTDDETLDDEVTDDEVTDDAVAVVPSLRLRSTPDALELVGALPSDRVDEIVALVEDRFDRSISELNITRLDVVVSRRWLTERGGLDRVIGEASDLATITIEVTDSGRSVGGAEPVGADDGKPTVAVVRGEAATADDIVSFRGVVEELTPLVDDLTLNLSVEVSVLFDLDEDTLKDDGQDLVDRIADLLLAAPGSKTSIGGHADCYGSQVYNEDLSSRRAVAVEDRLLRGTGDGERQLDESQLQSRGFGENVQRATNLTEAGRAQNRRVDFAISTGTEFPAYVRPPDTVGPDCPPGFDRD